MKREERGAHPFVPRRNGWLVYASLLKYLSSTNKTQSSNLDKNRMSRSTHTCSSNKRVIGVRYIARISVVHVKTTSINQTFFLPQSDNFFHKRVVFYSLWCEAQTNTSFLPCASSKQHFPPEYDQSMIRFDEKHKKHSLLSCGDNKQCFTARNLPKQLSLKIDQLTNICYPELRSFEFFIAPGNT